MQIARGAQPPHDVTDEALEPDEAVEELRSGERVARAEFEQLMEVLADRQDDAPYAH